MTFKGSVVVKRTTLLSMIQDMKLMFRSDVSPASKNHVWGQQIAYENVLKEDLTPYSWNSTIQQIWCNLNPRSFHEGMNWLFQSQQSAPSAKRDEQ